MKIGAILFLIFFATTALKAQSKNGKAGYYLIPQIALLNGDNSASAQVQLTGGIEKKGWDIGIGAAVDYYKIRTVPVFADLRTYFGKNRSLFSYLNIGIDLAWPLESQYSDYWRVGDNRSGSFNNGLYTDLGIGYAFHGKKNRGVVISLGYSTKTITEKFIDVIYRDFPPYGADYYQRELDYTLNRVALRFGIRL